MPYHQHFLITFSEGTVIDSRIARIVLRQDGVCYELLILWLKCI